MIIKLSNKIKKGKYYLNHFANVKAQPKLEPDWVVAELGTSKSTSTDAYRNTKKITNYWIKFGPILGNMIKILCTGL